MRISLTNPIQISTDDGDVACNEAEVSLAVSNSVAVRIVPVDTNGTEHPMIANGIVGDATQEDIATFMSQIQAALEVLIAGRGL